ncbi:MAG TPA: DUF429 domain-containing protein [Burkholderiales bacterium]|jgi:hypothetical protein|nr:DUF429 domain-containing protein [Burkholderiales bacterium]
MRILGVDFTCAPRRAKPIVGAVGFLKGRLFHLESLQPLFDFKTFEQFLLEPGPWVGGFDFPFGLPRELVRDLGWPKRWRALVELCGDLTRREFRGILDGYRATRPSGRKYAHRSTDFPAGSSSPMKLVNPPVALMFHEGAPRLIDAGVHIPGLLEGDRTRIALEAYPGLLARSILGRVSYKNDTKLKQTPERRRARARIVENLNIKMTYSLRKTLVADASGDSLDAVLCAVQAAGAMKKRNYGIPAGIGCEGWIISA